MNWIDADKWLHAGGIGHASHEILSKFILWGILKRIKKQLKWSLIEGLY